MTRFDSDRRTRHSQCETLIVAQRPKQVHLVEPREDLPRADHMGPVVDIPIVRRCRQTPANDHRVERPGQSGEFLDDRREFGRRSRVAMQAFVSAVAQFRQDDNVHIGPGLSVGRQSLPLEHAGNGNCHKLLPVRVLVNPESPTLRTCPRVRRSSEPTENTPCVVVNTRRNAHMRKPKSPRIDSADGLDWPLVRLLWPRRCGVTIQQD